MKMLFLALAVLVGGTVNFDRTIHDFGTVSVKDGPQSCEFTVTNEGSEDVNILAVTTSCGCTDVKWTREAIKPGTQGKVSVTYSNDEGPYPFDKVLSVYLSNVKKPVTLHIRGTVTNKKGK